MENLSNFRDVFMDSHSFEWDTHSVTEKPTASVLRSYLFKDLSISVQEEWDSWAVGGKLPLCRFYKDFPWSADQYFPMNLYTKVFPC